MLNPILRWLDFLAMHFTVFHKTNEFNDEGCEGVDAVQYEENISLIEKNMGGCLSNPKKISLIAHNIEESNKSGYCGSKKQNPMNKE